MARLWIVLPRLGQKTVVFLAVLTISAFGAIPAGAETSMAMTNPYNNDMLPIAPGESQLYEVVGSSDLRKVDSGAITAAGTAFGPCVLSPSRTYLRESSRYGAVGSKPYTECSVFVTEIRHSANLYTVEFLQNSHLVKNFKGNNYNQKRLEPKNISWPCVNTNDTRWWTITTGTIIYGGKTYYSQVSTPISTLECGRY